jgi:hypothetical protein
MVLAWIATLPWSVVVLACLTLGLAPFTPPHIVEKLGMLFTGKLVKPIDWFDLFLHGAPWLLLLAKAVVTVLRPAAGAGS